MRPEDAPLPPCTSVVLATARPARILFSGLPRRSVVRAAVGGPYFAMVYGTVPGGPLHRARLFTVPRARLGLCRRRRALHVGPGVRKSLSPCYVNVQVGDPLRCCAMPERQSW